MRQKLRFVTALALVLGLVVMLCGSASANKSRIASDEEMLSALAEMREKEAVGFKLSLTKKYWSGLAEDDLAGFSRIVLAGGITYYHLSYTSAGDLEFDDVQWTEPHYAECATEEEFRTAVRDQLSRGVPSCQILVKDETVFRSLLEGKIFLYAAMYGAESLQVRNTTQAPYIIYLDEIKPYSSPWRVVSSAEEWTAAVEELTGQHETCFWLVPEPAFAEALAQDEALVRQLEATAPMAAWRTFFSEHGLTYRYEFTASLPGWKIACAVAKDDLHPLTKREKETLAAASLLAEKSKRGDDLSTALAIHDALCDMNVYTDDPSTEEDDNAIGALLNGEANCDGYADAFFLAGTLAGLEVRYQQGQSRERQTDEVYRDVGHLWNLLKIDGTWRLVDVTWDDQADETVYTWFNLGLDRARLMHTWDEQNSVPLLAETDLSQRPGHEYLIRDTKTASAALNEARKLKLSTFALILPEDAKLDRKELMNLVGKKTGGSYHYSWNSYMRTMTVTKD